MELLWYSLIRSSESFLGGWQEAGIWEGIHAQGEEQPSHSVAFFLLLLFFVCRVYFPLIHSGWLQPKLGDPL